MRKNILIIAMLLCLFGFATACENDGGGGYTPPTPPEPISLIGVWYEVGSTVNKGVKVTFTETHCIALSYWKDYVFQDPVYGIDTVINDTFGFWGGYGSDSVVTYEILSDSKMKLAMTLEDAQKFCFECGPDSERITPFSLVADTLTIEIWYTTGKSVPYPENMESVKLIKEKKNE